MELRNKVACLIAETDRTHRYSMSAIYGTYNEVFDRKETPQSCASCLIRKVEQLRTWLSQQTSTDEAPIASFPKKQSRRKQS